jgi:CHAT domain-containing protein
MAPFFEEKPRAIAARSSQRAALGPLPYSGEEVARAAKRFGKNALVRNGHEADKSFFTANAARFSTLHLATHAKANHKAGAFSYLAFAGDPEPELLSVGELYNLALNADLVLLSACETAIGEEQRGEGVVSLARAFAYAGAKSVVASLWSANDRSTMLVVDSFYEAMLAGKPKHIALADAKRQYLNQNPGRNSHPFFWAAFVGVGAW